MCSTFTTSAATIVFVVVSVAICLWCLWFLLLLHRLSVAQSVCCVRCALKSVCLFKTSHRYDGPPVDNCAPYLGGPAHPDRGRLEYINSAHILHRRHRRRRHHQVVVAPRTSSIILKNHEHWSPLPLLSSLYMLLLWSLWLPPRSPRHSRRRRHRRHHFCRRDSQFFFHHHLKLYFLEGP